MGPRPTRKSPAVIRSDATPAKVYNEGLCVYLWDPEHEVRLREMMSGTEYGGGTPAGTFFDCLTGKAFGKAVRDAGLALAYTLQQDDEVEVEVAVGKPLTAEELSVACWLKPQHAVLDLPSGRLRIDTPNTMPLDPDEKSDQGSVVDVPPGRYLVTLYRVDWDALQRAGKRYRGPQEVILLTPAADARKGRTAGPILKYQPPKEAPAEPVRLTKGESAFECQFEFLSYWELYCVSMTRAEAEQLDLRPGTRLRFTVEKFVLEALYLGDMAPADFQRFTGRDALDAALSPFREFAVSEWSVRGGQECLLFRRMKATRCVPNRLLEIRVPAAGTVLPDPFPLPQAPPVRPPESSGEIIRGAVAFSSSEEVVLNVGMTHLETIGVKPGDLLRLEPEGAASRVLAWGDSPAARNQHTVVTGDLSPSHESTYRRLTELKLGNRFFTLGGVGRPSVYSGPLPVHHLGGGGAWPVVGVLLPPVDGIGEAVLRLTPFYRDGARTPEPWTEGLEAGSAIILRREAGPSEPDPPV